MIKISTKKTKCVCDNCGKSKNGYRNIHGFTVGNINFRLCTECMSILSDSIRKEFRIEFGERNETEEDKLINEKLVILLNRKLNNDWNEDCEKELCSLDVNKMRPSDKVLHRQIIEW